MQEYQISVIILDTYNALAGRAPTTGWSRCCKVWPLQSFVSATSPLTNHESNTAGGIEPVDLLLLMTASENDAPKTAEPLRAGADLSVKVLGLLKKWRD